ncbi:beta-amylase [Klebsormidium nitens]|uniref:Beta-amylase n=1 Tax=Klebsormidium nitens TaxID=105231 RepID=A0A1Y1IGC6_KLENI|nr:beta-amylase [Klebsormidium nitens]|eukprot:GAQ87188.1 beta-amylase [Klebsormidium nitens]
MALVAESHVGTCACSLVASTSAYDRQESGSFAGTSSLVREARATSRHRLQTFGLRTEKARKAHGEGLWPESQGPACYRSPKVHLQATRCFQEAAVAASKEERATTSGGRSQMATAEQQLFAGLPVLEREQAVEKDGLYPDLRRPARTEQEVLLSHYIPVYVMLPLDTVTPDNLLSHPERLLNSLRALKAAGVDGCMADVWWGVVEKNGPKQYDWSAYRALFSAVSSVGLKMQVVMSFHQCGGNTGDSCYIPLPPWVLDIGELNPDIFFTNRDRMRNREYLSFSIDERPELDGRSAIQVYKDFMVSFRNEMREFFEAGLFHEIEVGVGPAGELRFPSYPETHGWRFPGIGEFQCYDRYMLEQLGKAAEAVDRYEWGYSGPHDSGRYNDWPHATGFFGSYESFNSEYGRFFLEWYSNVLLKHGDKVLEAASEAFEGCTTRLAAKVAGVHWWYNSRNHAAELAAGYYNTRERDGYLPIAAMLKRHNATLNFTCIEMRNSEQWFEAKCSPEGLVQQVLNAAWSQGVEVSCENALPRYDLGAFDQIIGNARPDGVRMDGVPVRRISSFTFLRLGPELMIEHNWNEFVRFVRRMHAGLDYHPTPELYFRPLCPITRTQAEASVAPPPTETEELLAEAPVNTSPEDQDQTSGFFGNVFGWSSKKAPEGPSEPVATTASEPTSLILREEPPNWFSFLSPPPPEPEIEPAPETSFTPSPETTPSSVAAVVPPPVTLEIEILEVDSTLLEADQTIDVRDESPPALVSPGGPRLDGPMLEPVALEEPGELWKGNLEVGINRLLPVEEPAPLEAPRRSVESGAIESIGSGGVDAEEDSLSAYYGRLARNALEKKRALEREAREGAPVALDAEVIPAGTDSEARDSEEGSGQTGGVMRFFATTLIGLVIGLALWLCSPNASASRLRIATELDQQVQIVARTVLSASREADSARRSVGDFSFSFFREQGSQVQAIKASITRDVGQTVDQTGLVARFVKEQGKKGVSRFADVIKDKVIQAQGQAAKLGHAARLQLESWRG